MNLYRKIISGNTFVSEKVSGVFPYLLADTNPDALIWEDITSIETWHEYGKNCCDYVRCTKEMSLLFDAKTGADEAAKFANCTAEEKECLSKRHVIHDKATRLTVLSAEDDFNCFVHHAKKSIEARQNRIDAAHIAIGYELSEVVDRIDLYNEVMPRVSHFVGSNDPDLKDWVKSVGAYVGGGMQAKAYWNQGIEDIFVQIVEDGIY